MKISDITIEKVRRGELSKEFPELYELENIIENNESHDNDSVLNHTVSVMEKLKEIFESRMKFYYNFLDNY